jgi:hypothetical protein
MAIGQSKKPVRVSQELEHVLVGLRAGSLVAINCHFPRGTACWRYVIAARQWGSIEGREKAGPQT